MEWNSDLVREKSENEILRAAAVGRTAAAGNFLIERTRAKQVNLCESQGDSWVTIRRDITIATAERFGFSRTSPAVESVFAGWPNG